MSKVSEFVKLGTKLRNKRIAEDLLKRKQSLLELIQKIKKKQKEVKRKIYDLEYLRKKGTTVRTETIEKHHEQLGDLEKREKETEIDIVGVNRVIYNIKKRLGVK